MVRALSTKNLFDKQYKTFGFSGLWAQAMGEPTRNGIWTIYGKEKHGKTWFTLMIADVLSEFERVLYISAEEGMDKPFVEAVKRAGIKASKSRLNYLEYIPIDELEERLSKRKSPNVIILDNCTIYAPDFKGGVLRKLMHKYPGKLFIYVAHEEKNEPSNALGQMAKKLSKIIVRVQGLTAFISGRCPGGTISIDEQKSQLFWGTIENE